MDNYGRRPELSTNKRTPGGAFNAAGSYREYLQTDHWQRIRWATLWMAGNRCQLCNCEEDLEVHHNGYNCLFNERSEDLVVFRRECHEVYSLTEKVGADKT